MEVSSQENHLFVSTVHGFQPVPVPQAVLLPAGDGVALAAGRFWPGFLGAKHADRGGDLRAARFESAMAHGETESLDGRLFCGI